MANPKHKVSYGSKMAIKLCLLVSVNSTTTISSELLILSKKCVELL